MSLSPSGPAHRGQLRQGPFPAVLTDCPHKPRTGAHVCMNCMFELVHIYGRLEFGALMDLQWCFFN